MKLAAVSVDLDEVGCYAAIHGIELPEAPSRHAVYDRCLPRLAELFEEERLRATFFAIGSDLERTSNQRAVKALHGSGHEIANHSFHHNYDMSRRSRGEIRRDIERGAAAIEAASGERPVGFRAPGYTITDDVFDILENLGVRYDSSVFPCPTYYAAKVSALLAMAMRGRKSQSIVDSPSVLRCPKVPYRIGRPYWRRGAGLLELPIGVTGWGLPYIGTSLVMAGMRGARLLTHQMLHRNFVQVELHGFDVADATSDDLHALAPYRPDLKKTASEKLAVIRNVIGMIRDAGFELVPLRRVAEHLSERPNP